eukprot:scaffold13289_cov33-Prasinocladus_malaysianus.AAC.1
MVRASTYLRKVCERALSITRWVKNARLQQAAALADAFLLPRSSECTAAFLEIINRASFAAEAEEKSAFFWSPNPDDTVQAAEAAGGAFRKLNLNDFLSALCAEYKRLEEAMVEVLPVMFKDYDTNGNGFIERYVFID